ncbi:MAG: preprotein translocase subunit SecE [Elusimicrobia bacterium]|nr:preprotein translocase subunit SecE [Elusimicrobiota bacterium]
MNEWIKAAIRFFKDSYAELGKVTWLSRREAVASTIIVIILVVIVSIFVGFIDFLLARILGIIL